MSRSFLQILRSLVKRHAKKIGVGQGHSAPKVPDTSPVALSPEEVLQFLECLEHIKHRTILTTCYVAGLRNPAPQDLSIGCNPVSADMPITRHAVEKACQEASSYAAVFPSHNTPFRFGPRSLSICWKNGTDVRTIQLLMGHRSLSRHSIHRSGNWVIWSFRPPENLVLNPPRARACGRSRVNIKPTL